MKHQQMIAEAAWPPRKTMVPDAYGSPDGGAGDRQISIGDLLAVLAANRRALLTWLAACMTLACLYLYVTPPEYVAFTQIILEPRRQAGTGMDAGSGGFPPILDSAQAESQIQVVKSERVLRFVFETLNLVNAPEFTAKSGGLRQSLARWVPFLAASPEVVEATGPRSASARAFQAFSDRVGVRRIGQSYVLEISYRSPIPRESARLANSVTAAYIRDQIELRASAAERSAEYLQGRITDVNAQQKAAAQAVLAGTIPDMRMPDSDARVISAALEPLGKAYPQSGLIVGFALMLGLLFGLAVIAVRHSLDRTIRSHRDVSRAFGIACLGVLPNVPTAIRSSRGSVALDTITANPQSDFAEALRVTRTAILTASISSRHHSIGIVSWSPREGRSSIASNLAYLIAASRERVALVDGDLRNPALSRTFAPDAKSGLGEALIGHTPPTDLFRVALHPTLAFVPAAGKGRASDPNLFIGSAEMQSLLTALHSQHDIIVDLPPLSRSSDAQAVSPFLDGIVLVVEANRTTTDDLTAALDALRSANAHLLGIVLNKVTTRTRARPPWMQRVRSRFDRASTAP